MADGGDRHNAFWGRKDLRVAIAAGYAALAALIFLPGQPATVTATSAPAVAAAETAGGAATAVKVDPKVDVKADASPAAATAPAAPAAAQKASTEDEAAIAALAKITDYQAARWHPLHFKPAIDTATNAQCLACHKEVLTTKVRETSPAGVSAAQSLAWYQTLDTYDGGQETFHARHLSTPLARSVMNLQCNFCHKGNDPREEAPGASATAASPGGFTLRKMVDPSKTCLMCHGKFPGEVMGFDTAPWHSVREGIETPDVANGCLSCHAEQFRTVRHQVTYLNAQAIEAEAKKSTDLCFGCHGGRAWYRTSYPYPRHPWPGMDPAVPDWAKDRPVVSAPEHLGGAN